MRTTYDVAGMHCSSCTMNIEDALLEVPGVSDAEASLRKNTVTVEHDGSVSDDAIGTAVSEAGYTLTGKP